VILGHGGGEVGGGVMGAVAPVHEQAVGPAIEHAVDADGFASAQAAGVVVARGVEPRMQASLDAPVLDVGVQPLRQRQVGLGPAGDEGDGFRFFVLALAVQPRGLCDQQKAGGFPIEFARDESAGDRLALLEVGPAQRRRIVQRGKRGWPGSGTRACTAATSAGWLALTVIR
jgi:hypothetical protein